MRLCGGGSQLALWRCQGFLRGLTPLTMEGTLVTWKGGRETDTAKRGLAMEWELSGAPVTAFRHRGDGDRIPPFQAARRVLSSPSPRSIDSHKAIRVDTNKSLSYI